MIKRYELVKLSKASKHKQNQIEEKHFSCTTNVS
jgi:hypothetical protein